MSLCISCYFLTPGSYWINYSMSGCWVIGTKISKKKERAMVLSIWEIL